MKLIGIIILVLVFPGTLLSCSGGGGPDHGLPASPAAYVLATRLDGDTVFKIDPATHQVVSRADFSTPVGRPAADAGRRLAYLPLDDRLVALRTDSMESALLAVSGLGKAGSFAALSPDGTTLAVVNHGPDGLRSPDDRLDIVSLDPAVWPPAAALSFSITVGQQPIRTIIDHQGRYAVVSVRDDDVILVVDLASHGTATSFALPAGSEPEGLDLHPVENIVYVTLHGTNAIEIIDLDANPPRLMNSVPILSGKGGPQPSGGAFTPDGGRFYVSAQVTNEVLLFDASNAAAPVQDLGVSLPSARQPHDIVFFPDGSAYVANTYNTEPAGSISVIRDYDTTPAVSRTILTNVILNPLYLVYFPKP
jgi:DNA-binding beta-propeller fold protein YncE